MKNNKLYNQKGTSLFEALGIIFIISIIGSSTFSLYNKALSKVKDNSILPDFHAEEKQSIILGPYKQEYFFPQKYKSSYIFLKSKCGTNITCRRSFCGEITLNTRNEVFIALKDLNFCLKELAKKY